MRFTELRRTRPEIKVVALGAGLLLLFWLTRVFALTSFPPFTDEAFHIKFAENMANTGSPFANASEGRVLTISWYYVLAPYTTKAAFWVARAATIVSVLPGFAALVGLSRLAAKTWGMLFAGILLTFVPYFLFFQRMALADPVAASAVSLGMYFSYRLKLRVDNRDAVLSGIMLFLAVGAKVSALPYLGIPIAAALFLHAPGFSWRKQIRWLLLALAMGVGLTGVFYGMMFWRGYDPFYYLTSGSPGSDMAGLASLTSAVGPNLDHMIGTFVFYMGPIFLLSLIGFIVLVWQRQYFLPIGFALPQMVYLLSSRQSTRHLFIPITMFVLIGTVAAGRLLAEMKDRRMSLALGGGVLILCVLGGIRFATVLYSNPAEVPVFEPDRQEYIAAEGSGFGLGQVISVLEEYGPNRVIAILPNCDSLRYMTLNEFDLECPRLNPNGEDIAALEKLMEGSLTQGTLVVLELVSYGPQTAPGTLITEINDASGHPAIAIYDLSP